MTIGVWQRCLMVTASITLAVFGISARASADTLWGVTSTGNLITFDSATPGTVASVAITGLQPGETLLGIDQRPATGQLYGLGSTNRLYLINPTTGVATAVSAAPFAALDGTSFGFDFNPTVDAIRVVSNNEQNFRLNPNTGAIAGSDTALNPPGSVVASAYVNNFAGTTTTTLYGIDSAADTLVLQGGVNSTPSPNLGVITSVGPLGVDTADEVGFDIASNNTAFAAFNVAGGGTSSLFTINLSTGAATSVGAIGSGLLVTALAVQSPVAVTLYGVTPTNALISFNSAAPGTILSTVGISGPAGRRVGARHRRASGHGTDLRARQLGPHLHDRTVERSGAADRRADRVERLGVRRRLQSHRRSPAHHQQRRAEPARASGHRRGRRHRHAADARR